MNDNQVPPVSLIVGRARRTKEAPHERLHIMLCAPDDDSAVRMALNALNQQGYAEVDLDQIGEMDDAPDEEPHASAYQGALEGEVAIVVVKENGGWR